ncbi:MAG: LPP20 family lipoprotein [Treponema sp.]|nr:LPP20 family lipoprotein [Treponema sp.]
MKKAFFAALVVAVAFAAASCGTAAPAVAPGDPVGDFITEARRNANENALLGIGTARHSNRALATQTATARALADIARQLNVVVSNMITDYIAGSEAEPQAMLAFQESVTQTLARERLVGTRPIAERMIDGEMVVVMELAPSNAATNIMNASESAAALAPHMGAAMWALDRMDQALQQQNMAPPVIRNYD